MVKTLYIVRHCSAEGQPFEAKLTSEGEKQAFELANFFEEKEIDFIVSSPYVRAMKSIEPFALSKGLQIQTDNRLGERVLSTGHLDDWLSKLEASFIDLDLSFDGGESSREAMERGREVVDELFRSIYSNIVIVSHGNLTALLLKTFDDSHGFKTWKQMSNPDVFEVLLRDGSVKVNRVWK